MQTTPLHPDFGLRVDGVDLRDLSRFAALRALFDGHSLLFFPRQHLTDDAQMALAARFGPVENRTDGPAHVPRVSNLRADGGTYAADDLRTLDLQANFLWHTDSTFLPVPALVNVAQARVVAPAGGATEFVSTRAGFARLEPALQARLRETFFRHRLSHSRARIDPRLAEAPHIAKWGDQIWRAVWQNPETGAEALYIASHACGAEGMGAEEGAALIDSLIAAMTPPEAIYRHEWQVGDVLIWDERATLHRGTPWDYATPRELASVCASAEAKDGLDRMHAA